MADTRATTILPPDIMRYGRVGFLFPFVEIASLDVPDAGHFVTNSLEILTGASANDGYHKRDDLDNGETTFTRDG